MTPAAGLVAAIAAGREWSKLGAIAIGLAAGLTLMLVCLMAVEDIRGSVRGDPLFLTVDILEEPGANVVDEKVGWMAYMALFGRELLADVGMAVRLTADGSTTNVERFLACRTLKATRHVHQRVKPGEEVDLVCTSGGRAIATLAEIVESAARSSPTITPGRAAPPSHG
jgi:hypothetical protein